MEKFLTDLLEEYNGKVIVLKKTTDNSLVKYRRRLAVVVALERAGKPVYLRFAKELETAHTNLNDDRAALRDAQEVRKAINHLLDLIRSDPSEIQKLEDRLDQA